MMILARINGTPVFGFAEAVAQGDGSVNRKGMVALRPPDAMVLQSIIERQEPLVYSGPVWVNDAWRPESFPITATLVRGARELPASISIAQCGESTPALLSAGDAAA